MTPTAEEVLRTYRAFRPTGFDAPGLCAGDEDEDPHVTPIGSWYVCAAGHNRDSGSLTESNWAAQLDALRAADPDADDHAIHRFGHWGPGWYEIVLVRPGSKAAEVAAGIACQLEDYPALDEEDWSRREWEGACSYWEHAGLRERIEACVESNVSIFAARRDEMPGECFDYCNPDRC